jgi:hypothetical protein
MLDAGYSIITKNYPYLSSITYLANCGISDRFHDVVILGVSLPGLGIFSA